MRSVRSSDATVHFALAFKLELKLELVLRGPHRNTQPCTLRLLLEADNMSKKRRIRAQDTTPDEKYGSSNVF